MRHHLHDLGIKVLLPCPVYFRYDEFPADTHYAAHSHDWGQLNYVARGVMQLEIDGQRFLSPPHYAVWIPPNASHSSYNAQALVYRSVYLARELCGALPAKACTLAISPLLRALLDDFAVRDVAIPKSDADLRLAQVLVDQLALAPVETHFLPLPSSPVLTRLLQRLQDDPADTRTQHELAAELGMTERTLARYCQRELGMSLGDWRQRQRLLHAISALESGRTIQQIAFDLGYSTASAFSAMFLRQAGCTPEQYRAGLRA
ncbi:AraC-type DNA-binding protein [Andreprevotia lacus DSM 23236]|jgi:AraC-like DNA-binding protein|uniref:AraC-type DNA-binding protein n=1 Tax=Andreprevotia lacus DSM 23236 TaxID=1121001 RepID=A0A1W1XSE4_9NEIS|nr:helix-turn-helix transcriptional regulator [Andreprevotia lacus]SMC26471.1 AraC-type DNA-binding protein [Andreprevotia lacus DSM 23236]